MRKPRHKLKGVMLITTVIAVMAWILLAGGVFLTQSNSFQAFGAGLMQLQAQYLAKVDAKALSTIRYDKLGNEGSFTEIGLHTSRATMKNTNATGWEDEIRVGSEKTLSSTLNGEWPYRIVTVNIYRQGDSIPRYTLDVPFVFQAETYSKEEVDAMVKKLEDEAKKDADEAKQKIEDEMTKALEKILKGDG